MTALLDIRAVSCRFGGLLAVDDVSARIEAGELVGLIGPNGAGKTTLFNLICGFTAPGAGSVHFAGARIDGLPPWRIARRGIGRTFQNLRVFPNMSVFDNVSVGAIGAFGLSWPAALFAGRHKARAISERSWAALAAVGLADQAGQLAANLSYGRRKYLEIARALALQPRLLILDEPAAGLNDSETAQLAGFIRDLHTAGTTVLLVEHDMGLVMSVCRRVLVLASGRLIADLPPEAARRDPAVLDAYLGVEA